MGLHTDYTQKKVIRDEAWVGGDCGCFRLESEAGRLEVEIHRALQAERNKDREIQLVKKLLSGVKYMRARYTYLPLKLKYDPTAS